VFAEASAETAAECGFVRGHVLVIDNFGVD